MLSNKYIQKENIFIELTLTNNCNCKCEYCFEGCHTKEQRDQLEEERQLFLLKDLILKFDKDKFETITISMWGGEPFLNFEFLNKIIIETYQFSFVRYHIYSNGTLVDKYKLFLEQEYINDIKERLHIQLSYDGEPIHRIKRGNNSENIFTVADLLLLNNIKFSFKATLPFDQIKNLTLVWDDYYKLFIKYGNNVTYFPTLDTNTTDESQLDIFESQLKQIVKREKQFIQLYGRPLMGWFNGRKSNCLLKNSIFIHNNGNIYLCHGCPYLTISNHFKYANTKNISSLSDILEHNYINYDLNTECSTCESTYCSVCHITQINTNDNPLEAWSTCRTRNNIRCRYFKLFGKYNKILNYITAII